MAGSGLVALVAMTIAHVLNLPGLTVSFSPLAFPSIPLLPVIGILVAAVPAMAAPRPISPSTRQSIETCGRTAELLWSKAVVRPSSDLSGAPA